TRRPRASKDSKAPTPDEYAACAPSRRRGQQASISRAIDYDDRWRLVSFTDGDQRMADQSERDPFPPERQGNPNVKLLLGAIAVAYIALVAFMWNRESPIAVVETEWTGKPAP